MWRSRKKLQTRSTLPIKRRDTSAPSVQVPAPPRKHIRDPDAFLDKVPNPRRVAMVVYDEVPTSDVPIDDMVFMLRTSENKDTYEQATRNRIKGRMTAIRAYCVLCVGGPRKVKLCSQIQCPLWGFRMGNNPYNRRKAT